MSEPKELESDISTAQFNPQAFVDSSCSSTGGLVYIRVDVRYMYRMRRDNALCAGGLAVGKRHCGE